MKDLEKTPKVTLEDFENFVKNRPVPDTPGFYKLWRLKCKDTGYTCHEVEYQDDTKSKAIGAIWRFPIQPLSEMEYEYHPTFEDAYESMTQPSQIDSEIVVYSDPSINYTFGYRISRLGFGPRSTRDFYVEYRHYDRYCNEYDRSSCSSHHWNTPGIYGKYLGRFPEQIPFKDGDLVEIGASENGKEYSVLGVVIGIPRTVKEVWAAICDDVNKLNCDNQIEAYFEAPDKCGVDDEEYFVLFGPVEESLRYTTFRYPSEVRPPSFDVPEKAKKTMIKYYNDYLNSIKEE